MTIILTDMSKTLIRKLSFSRKIAQHRSDANPLERHFIPIEANVLREYSEDIDYHLQILPVWSSKSEISIVKERYLWFLVWDQNYFRYLNSISFCLNIENRNIATEWTKVWVSTYLLERMITDSPKHAWCYLQYIKKLDMPPMESLKLVEGFSPSIGGDIYHRQRTFALFHEIAHVFHKADQSFVSKWSGITNHFLAILKKLFIFNVNNKFEEFDLNEKTINIRHASEDYLTLLLEHPNPSIIEELSCDAWAINRLIEVFGKNKNREDFKRLLDAITLICVTNAGLQQSRHIKLDEPYKNGIRDNNGDITLESSFAYHFVRYEFLKIALIATYAEYCEVDINTDWIMEEAEENSKYFSRIDSLMRSSWAGAAEYPSINEDLSLSSFTPKSKEELVKTFGWN